MIFTTWPFLLLMGFVFVCYWWIVPPAWRRLFLMLASVGYFTYNYPPHTLMLGTLTIIVWGLGRILLKQRTEGAPEQEVRTTLVVGLLVCTGVLGIFKYSKMFVQSYNGVMKATQLGSSLPIPDWVVPLGISFFTFEFIHYLADIYMGKVKQQASLLDFSLFAFFFPSLVAGPVKRFQIFQQQTEEIDKFQVSYLNEGLKRIFLGIAKKLIIADTADLLIKPLILPQLYSRPLIWLAMYAYGVKIYYDFSGYTDIAIGCGQLLGYRLPENFNRPYMQTNLAKFWNNWHMSLSSWIRDYLFIPLGGSRVHPLRILFNLTIVMTICGLWHGANWTFVVWGLWNGLGLVGIRLIQQSKVALPDTLPFRWLNRALTVQYVCLGWVFFAAPSLDVALEVFRRMLFKA